MLSPMVQYSLKLPILFRWRNQFSHFTLRGAIHEKKLIELTVFWLHLIMYHTRRFVLTVQSRRFSQYFSEFPAVNMFILKHNNLHIIKWMDSTHSRLGHSFYNIQIVVFQYSHVNCRKLWTVMRKATWLHC